MSEEIIKPYGDTFNDGMVQLSFTLPVENCARARRAAEQYVLSLNFEDVRVVHSRKIAENFTFFVVYAVAIPKIDYSTIEASEVKTGRMTFKEINELIKIKLKRRLTVIGASIGSDAHTVGIDAIMNMKGYNHDYGLERYPEINAFNMGSQVDIEDLIKRAVEADADAILVSQTITQKNSHTMNYTELIEKLKAGNLRDRFLLIAGGPRITNDYAVELGYDAGFGPGSLPSHVASYIVTTILERRG